MYFKGSDYMLSMDNLKLLCELSKLHLSEDEMKEYQKEMTDIINLMDTIGDSDFEYNPIDMTNAIPFGELRADNITEFDNMDGIVKNGPEVIENQFVVPKIVD
ncbi:MAG: Asp-tRNA(Asn)/Glu-tRNA(Gln) amidotransferase subunit GatC [Ruminococcaceae bacterium]|nr:Asp-tRNA(Asn)/Glu-tRNA(Gln) amidotransferase subunit GatC [Oscillospiraceae bacterium]